MVKNLEVEVQIGERWRVPELGKNPDWKGIPYAEIDPSTIWSQDPCFFSQNTETEVIDGPVTSQRGLRYYKVKTQSGVEGYISRVHFRTMEKI